MTEQPKVEEWMLKANSIGLDMSYASLQAGNEPPEIGINIAMAYAPEAARVKALVDKMEWILNEIHLEHCDGDEHCTWCENLTEALADYRKGDG